MCSEQPTLLLFLLSCYCGPEVPGLLQDGQLQAVLQVLIRDLPRFPESLPRVLAWWLLRSHNLPLCWPGTTMLGPWSKSQLLWTLGEWPALSLSPGSYGTMFYKSTDGKSHQSRPWGMGQHLVRVFLCVFESLHSCTQYLPTPQPQQASVSLCSLRTNRCWYHGVSKQTSGTYRIRDNFRSPRMHGAGILWEEKGCLEPRLPNTP